MHLEGPLVVSEHDVVVVLELGILELEMRVLAVLRVFWTLGIKTLGIKTHSIPSLPFLTASLWPGEQARWWWSCHLLDLLSCWFHGVLMVGDADVLEHLGVRHGDEESSF